MILGHCLLIARNFVQRKNIFGWGLLSRLLGHQTAETHPEYTMKIYLAPSLYLATLF
jgi:hypothetical protein